MINKTEYAEVVYAALALVKETNYELRIGQALYNCSSEEVKDYILTLEDQSAWYCSRDNNYCIRWYYENVVNS